MPFFLDSQNPPAIEAWLHSQRLLPAGQRVLSAARAGEGNMNLTLRVVTPNGSLILKQARPWVEKYPSIPAPDERALVEADFYNTIAAEPSIAGLMPRLLGHSAEDRILVLEDLFPAADCTGVYATGDFHPANLRALTAWLQALHSRCTDPHLAARFANPKMRALNHAHIFRLPLRRDTGWNLDDWTPGLALAAAELWNDSAYCGRVEELGHIYLGTGVCLVHGDFFPGSWMRTENSVYVIDPEFCFWGQPEFDHGVMFAHLLLARAPRSTLDICQPASPLASAFAGVEIMRRLIGVAQLPLPYGIEEKVRLLEISRQMVLAL
ncbi:MAG: phosphotransferase [Bryobacterales bacterium]|nr:phosphotransferase [Bryobacterales bacterium]